MLLNIVLTKQNSTAKFSSKQILMIPYQDKSTALLFPSRSTYNCGWNYPEEFWFFFDTSSEFEIRALFFCSWVFRWIQRWITSPDFYTVYSIFTYTFRHICKMNSGSHKEYPTFQFWILGKNFWMVLLLKNATLFLPFKIRYWAR